DRGVVRDDDDVAPVDGADPDDHPRRRRAAVLLIETVGGPQAELEERRAGVAEGRHPLAGGHLPLRPLLGLRLLAPAQADRRRRVLAPAVHLAAPGRRAAREGVVPFDPARENAQIDPPTSTPRPGNGGGIIREGAAAAGRRACRASAGATGARTPGTGDRARR